MENAFAEQGDKQPLPVCAPLKPRPLHFLPLRLTVHLRRESTPQGRQQRTARRPQTPLLLAAGPGRAGSTDPDVLVRRAGRARVKECGDDGARGGETMMFVGEIFTVIVARLLWIQNNGRRLEKGPLRAPMVALLNPLWDTMSRQIT